MNLCIVKKDDFVEEDLIFISGKRAHHIEKVLKCSTGDRIRAGLLNGLMGFCEIVDKKDNGYYLRPFFSEEPPKPLDILLVVALPRPKVARRIVYHATTMGIKNIYFINSVRVEKSYWQSQLISEQELERQKILGLEQGMDTVLPHVHMEKFFKPFVEDKLPSILSNRKGLLMHPYSGEGLRTKPFGSSCLIIGPEGGFIEYENKKIMDAGAKPYSLGSRILRVETAVIGAIAQCSNLFAV